VENHINPIVSLGGKVFYIQLLTARQNRIIDPLILNLLPIFADWQQDRILSLSKLSQPHYEALQEIAYCAVHKSNPELTREAFMDLPITLQELVTAFPVIAQQTGIFSRGDPGEALAGNVLTGTP
jgi:hypothetical protein